MREVGSKIKALEGELTLVEGGLDESLGTLPNLGPGRPAPTARGPDWAVAVEAIDTVRTMLLHAVGPSGPQVVLVSSPAPAEGKTTLSGFLAESLVRGGYRTLLIDGDLRRPTAHSRSIAATIVLTPSMVPDAVMTASFSPVASMPAFSRAL